MSYVLSADFELRPSTKCSQGSAAAAAREEYAPSSLHKVAATRQFVPICSLLLPRPGSNPRRVRAQYASFVILHPLHSRNFQTEPTLFLLPILSFLYLSYFCCFFIFAVINIIWPKFLCATRALWFDALFTCKVLQLEWETKLEIRNLSQNFMQPQKFYYPSHCCLCSSVNLSGLMFEAHMFELEI